MMTFLNKNPLSKLIQILLVVGLTLYVTSYFATHIVDPLHDGIMIKPAVDMLRGKILFKDTFTQYGALSTIIQTTALRFFGEYLIVIKLLTVAFYGVIALSLWFIWAQFLPPVLSTLAVLVWIGLFPYGDMTIFFTPWSSVYALLCQLIALQLLFAWVTHKKSLLIFLVGACAAIAFWFRQPIGIFLFAAVLLFALLLKVKKQKPLPLIPLILGFLFIHLTFVYWLFSTGSLSHWWSQSIAFASSWEKAVATQYRFPIFQISQMLPRSYSAVSVWVLLPTAVLYQGYLILKQKKFSPLHLQLLAAVCISLFSWLQYYPMNDPSHCLWAATPMVGFFIYTAWNNRYKGSKRIIFFIVMLLLLLPDTFNGVRNAVNRTELTYKTFTEESILKGMKENIKNYTYFKNLLDGVRKEELKNPTTFVVSANLDALYALFGKNNVNCSPYYVDWNWKIFSSDLEKEYRTRMNACIATYRPLIITDRTHLNPKGYIRVTKEPELKCNSSDPVGYLLAPIVPTN